MALPTLNTFSPNTTILSSDVNTNFTNLRDRDTISSSGVVTVESTDDHVVINAGSTKLVKIKVLRQDDTSDSYQENSVTLTGWGWIVGDGVNYRRTESVTFGITFDAVPIPVVGYIGELEGSDPTTIDDLTVQPKEVGAQGYAVTVNGFTAQIAMASQDGGDPGSTTVTRRYGYSWHTMGELN